MPLAGSGVPAAVAVDLGSACTQVWASRQGSVSAATGDSFDVAGGLVRRGHILDEAGCIALLHDLVRRFPEPIAAGGVVVACRPVQATMTEQYALRRVVSAVFVPSRLLLIDSVRAAAMGAGAAVGTRLIVDVGAQLTEIALVDHGRVVAARRIDIGIRDVSLGAPVDLLADIVVRAVADLRGAIGIEELAFPVAGGMLLVGAGGLHPGLSGRLADALRVPVRCAASPRTAAVNGAGLAAMSVLRHPAV
ncbi:rod shape-determining protein [Actinoplanes sp. DH11]|uniref:rod shape-determining protein n=1 Tax=Actinoplanes sp. DH11 TaxID=2857011 RepID=UPI001E5CE983|nr:rod shape-determining protein [Actinoplanes sp. DH11]